MNGGTDIKLSERQYITLLVLSALKHGEDVSSEFVDAFLRHTALISELQLSERFVEAEDLDEELKDMLQEFCEEASLVLSSEEWATNMSDWECKCDVSDLVDGRLLIASIKNPEIGRNETYGRLVKAMEAAGASVATENSGASQIQDGMLWSLYHRSISN